MPIRSKVGSNPSVESYTYNIGSITDLQENVGLRNLIFVAPTSFDNALLGKIKDQKVNLTVSLAEMHQTVSMVTNLAKTVFSAFRSLRSGRALGEFLRTMSHPNTRNGRKLANQWLAWTYGWSPLMSDIHGLLQLIENQIREGKYIYTSITRTTNMTVSSPYKSSNPVSTDNLIQKGVARYKVDSSTLRTMSQSGITNPALLAWELIPYSFVFDWIINVGEYLSALDALVGITDLKCSKSGRFIRVQSQQPTSGSPYELNKGMAQLKEMITIRYGLSPLQPRLPSYQPHIGVRRMLSAIALLRNLK
nr:MAG: maturation protein [Sanya fiers-like virus 43]